MTLPLDPRYLATLCAQVYDPMYAKTAHTVWNDNTGAYAVHVKTGIYDVVCYRGSVNASDWVQGLVALPVWDPRLGLVHGGFINGVNDVMIAAELVCGPNVIVCGHSLGGARARLHAALLAYHGKPAIQCCVFGSPRPAFINVARLLFKSGTLSMSFRNRNDPVPLVPTAWVPGLGDPWVHPDNWLHVDAAPQGTDMGPLRDHSMAQYVPAMQAWWDLSGNVNSIVPWITPDAPLPQPA